MIAKKFASYASNDKFLIFASGVSNSKSSDQSAYAREFDLLVQALEKNNNKTIVYFSTCSIYDPSESLSRYVIHKKVIEDRIRKNAASFHIFRVSNVAGSSNNPNTILNFLYYHIANKINFDLWAGSSRNIIDIDDLFSIANYILSSDLYVNQTINIANPINYTVQSIINTFGKVLHQQPNYITIQKGSDFPIDISQIQPIIRQLAIDFNQDYLEKLIKKYYSSK